MMSFGPRPSKDIRHLVRGLIKVQDIKMGKQSYHLCLVQFTTGTFVF